MNTKPNSSGYEEMIWSELLESTKGRWGEIFEDLAPKLLAEAVANAPLHVPCPVHGGGNGYRLFEHFNQTGRGICNTCGPQRSGFETLAWAKRYSFLEAVREVTQWVRNEAVRPPRQPRPVTPTFPKMDPVIAERKIKEVWNASTPLAGTAAERYLERRGIWAENMPRTLRAHPGLPYYDTATRSFLGTFPCLLAPIEDKAGKLCSIHRIYLTSDGFKADVPDPKKMLSPCSELRGAAIKLYEPGETLGLAEGIETALAVRAVSRMPVWACVTAGLMEQVDVPGSVLRVVIWADLDRSERGIEAAERLADRMEELGKVAEIAIPNGPIPAKNKGVDWLDVMQHRGLNGFPAKWRRWRPNQES